MEVLHNFKNDNNIQIWIIFFETLRIYIISYLTEASRINNSFRQMKSMIVPELSICLEPALTLWLSIS